MGTLVFLQESGKALQENWRMTADSESRDMPYHLEYVRQVLCMSCCTWRSHMILTWTPYLLCVLGKTKNKIQEYPYFGSAYML